MKRRLVLILDENEVIALESLAKRELRTSWQQAALIIRQRLEAEGLISAADGEPVEADDDITPSDEETIDEPKP